MDIDIPKSFIEFDAGQFWRLLDSIDWKRDAFCDGSSYAAIGWETQFQQRYADGSVRTEQMARHAAIRTNGNRHYIDPAFFRPVSRCAIV